MDADETDQRGSWAIGLWQMVGTGGQPRDESRVNHDPRLSVSSALIRVLLYLRNRGRMTPSEWQSVV